VNPRDVEEMWMDRFKYFYREYVESEEGGEKGEKGFVYPVTVHPDVCGHPHGLMMLERYIVPRKRRKRDHVTDVRHSHIENINKFEGVEWVTMETICDTWKAKNQPPKGALLPAEPGAILEDRDLKLKVQE
jgi:hypothetical protein